MPIIEKNINTRWSEQQTKLAFYLYCQLPFGKLHYRNPQIISLAKIIGRTPSAVAMKLVNFASLDPDIRSTGRTGLANSSKMDKRIWDEFHNNWEDLTAECAQFLKSYEMDDDKEQNESDAEKNDYSGDMVATVTQRRLGQNIFRKMVLASYQEKCCMSHVSIPQLLVASHIVPWNVDKSQRLNPRNGLCLSAIHDCAFDRGYITVLPDMSILVSDEIKNKSSDSKLLYDLCSLDKKCISMPEKFFPLKEFLSWHNNHVYRG